MPFTHAVVTESLRMTSFASLGIPHFTSARATVGRKGDGEEGGKGFSLPAGTTVSTVTPILPSKEVQAFGNLGTN